MFTASDYEKLQRIMEESDENRELLSRLLDSHRAEVSAISHEIRNPLTLVYSELQLICTKHPEVLSFPHWEQLMQDVEYIRALLDELSSYNNSDRLNIAPVSATDFFRTAALSFASSIADTDIEFVSRIDPALPDIRADRIKLRQALFNLLANAKDALLASDTANPQICLSVETDVPARIPCSAGKPASCAELLLVRIRDNGCGIPAEEIGRIFEPFVTHKANGTGLGLAVSKRIAQAHGGSLNVSSVPGKCTEFVLALPV